MLALVNAHIHPVAGPAPAGEMGYDEDETRDVMAPHPRVVEH